MKKRIFSILTILWIFCSFCSALDSWSILNSYPSANCTNNDYKFRNINNSSDWFILKVKDSAIILKSICYSESPSTFFQNTPWYIYYSLDNWSTSTNASNFSNTSLGYCSSFGDWVLINPWDTFNYKLGGWSLVSCFSCCMYQPAWYGAWDYFVWNFYSQFISYWNSSTYVWPTRIYYENATLPSIFKINYWNTSVEYDLNSDLSIYFKSPVIQNWNTFFYEWKTWLNLFYNNSSQFYNRSNLYLDSMFWFSKNIFTPICL